MALQSSGAISLLDIATEFQDSAPHSMSEFYAADSGIPASGAISFNDFYGATNIKDHSFQFLGSSLSSSITVTVPTGVAQTSNDPVVVCTFITWDGVANSVNSPTINGSAPTWSMNTGGGYRGYTLTGASSVPAGTSCTCSFSPGGGYDYVGIMVYVVFDVPQVTPDLTYKDTSASPSYTLNATTYDVSSAIGIAENWQGTNTAFASPVAQGGYLSSQGSVRIGYVPTANNGGSESQNTNVTFNPSPQSTTYNEQSMVILAWDRRN